jgi:hypothetical protein
MKTETAGELLHWSWLSSKRQFPPILLLCRYLKLTIEYSPETNIMDVPLVAIPSKPFSFSAQ